MSIKFLVVLLAVAAVAHGEESENALETSFVELAPTGEFTLCLRETPSSCITVDGKEDTDGVGLKLSPRGPAANQKYKLADGFLSVSNKPTRVIGQEHGAHAKLATGGRIWIFAKSLARSDDQQWVLKGEDVKGATQICLKNHPAACLGTAADNSIILQVANAAPSWVLRPTDPCVGNPCGSNSKCTGNNADGSFKCTCNAGYEASAGSNRCFEVDACQRTPRPCDPNADCTKTGPGLFNCKCRPGFSGNGKTCAEIDPCAASVNPCGKNGDCVKTGPDAFHCKCKKGFAPESATSCIEIDACQSSPCDPNAICTKTGPGTNTCTCKVGYKGNGFKCKEVPACLALPCPEHSSCSPLGPGLRKCTCLPGYEFPEDNERVCKPINNCESSPCKGVNMKCTRTGPAKHICECEKGFVPLADNPLACDKPGSKNVLEAETRVKLNQVRKIIQSRIDEQKRKENAARSEREALERDFAKRQKQRQDAIRLLEKRVRELISDRTQARVSDRDARLTALRERIAILEKEELDAVNLAKEQIAVIKSLEAAEAKKLTGVEAELNAATQRILEETRKYARELREKLKKDHDALVEQAKKDEARRQAEAAKAEQERTAAAAAASNDYKPNPPPRVGDPALNNFAEVEAVAKDEQETEEEGEEEEEDENQESEEQESL